MDVDAYIQEETSTEDDPNKETQTEQTRTPEQTESPLTESPSEDQTSFAFDDFDWDDESDDTYSKKDGVCPKNRTQGFLIGMFTAWIVTGAGVLLYRLSKWILNYVAYLTDIPFDILVGLCILSIAALLLHGRARQIATFLKDWFDFDF